MLKSCTSVRNLHLQLHWYDVEVRAGVPVENQVHNMYSAWKALVRCVAGLPWLSQLSIPELRIRSVSGDVPWLHAPGVELAQCLASMTQLVHLQLQTTDTGTNRHMNGPELTSASLVSAMQPQYTQHLALHMLLIPPDEHAHLLLQAAESTRLTQLQLIGLRRQTAHAVGEWHALVHLRRLVLRQAVLTSAQCASLAVCAALMHHLVHLDLADARAVCRDVKQLAAACTAVTFLDISINDPAHARAAASPASSHETEAANQDAAQLSNVLRAMSQLQSLQLNAHALHAFADRVRPWQLQQSASPGLGPHRQASGQCRCGEAADVLHAAATAWAHQRLRVRLC